MELFIDGVQVFLKEWEVEGISEIERFNVDGQLTAEIVPPTYHTLKSTGNTERRFKMVDATETAVYLSREVDGTKEL